MKFKQPPLYGVALYKYALDALQAAALRGRHASGSSTCSTTPTSKQKITGDPRRGLPQRGVHVHRRLADQRRLQGARGAGSRTSRGRTSSTPSRTPTRAEKKLHVAIDRVRRPAAHPAGQALDDRGLPGARAASSAASTSSTNAVEVYETMLKKWPMDPTAPETQNAIAETYDQMNMHEAPGHARARRHQRRRRSRRAPSSRTTSATRRGSTPTRTTRRRSRTPSVSFAAVSGRAAAQHTNNGKAALVAASETGDAGRQIELLRARPPSTSSRASAGSGYLETGRERARRGARAVTGSPTRVASTCASRSSSTSSPAKRIQSRARRTSTRRIVAAIDVRDSNEDDKYLDNARVLRRRRQRRRS